MYGGDASRSNASAPALPDSLALLWEVNVGAGSGPSSVTVAESTVFAGTLAGEVRALDIATGRELGAYDFGGAVFGAPLLLGARIVAGLSGGGRSLACLNLRTGSVEWEAEGPGVESSPLLAGGVVIAAMVDGSVAAFDTLGGRERWRRRLPPSPGRPGIRSSPASDGRLVFAGTDGGEVIALDLGTGEPRWTAPAGGAVFGGIAAAGGRVFAATLRGSILAFDAADGSLLWKYDAGAPVYGGCALSDGAVVAGTSAGEVLCLDAADGALRWRTATAGGVGATPLVAGDRVVVGDLGKKLAVLSLADGSVRWDADVGGRIRATPVTAAGMLFVLAEDRRVLGYGGTP